MNRGLTSAPTNWAIDYGQNQTGQIYGNAMANTGGMLGNAIMQYAKDKKEREEKKAKEEAAARFILQSGAGKDMGIVDEKSAMQAVKGVGVDNIQNFIQLQQRQKQIEQETARVAAQEALVAQKAQEVEREKVKTQQFLGQISGSAPWRNAPAQSPQDVFAAAARTGVDPATAARMANALPPPAKQSGPAEFIQDPVTGARYLKSGSTVLPSKGQPAGDEVKKEVIGETTYFVRGDRYFDEKGKPVSFSTPPKSMLEQLNELKAALGVQSPEGQPPAPQAAPAPQSTPPVPGTRAKQNGKTYEFNGRDWVEV